MRASSSSIAERMTPSENWTTCVLIAKRSRGGVSITDISRIPSRDIFSVRGIGVAESVSTSTFFFSCLSFSLCPTPKRCSSSTTTRPSFGSFTSFERIRCVPMTTSTSPLAAASVTAFCSLVERNRDSNSTLTGNAAKRFLNVSKC